jgi:hypothetical protein
MNGKPLSVQDILSVFPTIDGSHETPAHYVVVQLMTAEGLVVLKTPLTVAQNLGDELSRATQHRRGSWSPDYRRAEA